MVREASNSFWNFGNARGLKSFCSSGRRKDVLVSAIKGSDESLRVLKFKVTCPGAPEEFAFTRFLSDRCPLEVSLRYIDGPRVANICLDN